MIAFADQTRIRLQNRRLNDRTLTYPEVTAALAEQGLHGTVVDGEVVVIDAGRPSFRLTMKRDNSGSPDRSLISRLPAVYVLFDLLYVGGESICDQPLHRRLERLRDLVHASDHLAVTDDHRSGIDLFQALGERGWEGIVSKQRDSRYLVGKKSGDWQKVKHFERDRFPVIGLVLRRSRATAVVLGEDAGTGLQPAGRAGSGLTDSQRERLGQLAADEITRGAPVSHRSDVTVVWIEADLTADVQYHERTVDGGLRAPVIKALIWPERGEGNG